ncbi:MAG: hypothetical protein RR510_11745 [Morganella sp. (in: enterobacteria)]
MKELASNEMNAVSGGCCGLIAVGTIAAVVVGTRVIKPALEVRCFRQCYQFSYR